jgi:hypothetical protein
MCGLLHNLSCFLQRNNSHHPFRRCHVGNRKSLLLSHWTKDNDKTATIQFENLELVGTILILPAPGGIGIINKAPTDNVSGEQKTFQAEGLVFTSSNGKAPPDLGDRLVSGFSLANFEGPEVVQYLSVCSLACFVTLCKYHALVVSREVKQRKRCIADIEDKVVRLMADTWRQPPGVPTRVAYSQAVAALAYAMSLIDGGGKILQRKMVIKLYYDIWCGWDLDY